MSNHESKPVSLPPSSSPPPPAEPTTLRQVVADFNFTDEDLQQARSRKDGSITYSVWDMAGQTVFYNMLNMLMTK